MHIRNTSVSPVCSYTIAILAVACAGSISAQSVHGTVVGDDGKPLGACPNILQLRGSGWNRTGT
jgi:hypothetical protein